MAASTSTASSFGTKTPMSRASRGTEESPPPTRTAKPSRPSLTAPIREMQLISGALQRSAQAAIVYLCLRGRVEVGEHRRQLRELQPVELDVLPRRQLAVAAAVAVRDLADRAELRRGQVPARQLDPEHERPDLRLVVVEAPALQSHDVLLGHGLVPGRDESRQLVPDAERVLFLLQPLDRVSLEDQLPSRLGLVGGARSS